MDSEKFGTESLNNKDVYLEKEGATIVLRHNGGSIRSTIYFSDWTKTQRIFTKKLKEESMLDDITIQEVVSCMSDNYKTLVDAYASYKADKEQSALASMAANSVPLTDELKRETTFPEIASIMAITIKQDYAPKVITFNAYLLAQTEDDQLNVGFQSESASGKSYIALQVIEYFPKEEVEIIAGASPTAFFHDQGVWDNKRKVTIRDLEHKILLFLDVPHFLLLEKLRPLLSHDVKELHYKITDHNERHGLRTKNVMILGPPTLVLCSTRMDHDEQEKTRSASGIPVDGSRKIERIAKINDSQTSRS